MAEADNPLAAWSDRTAQIVELAASSIVAVHGGSRLSSSGVHWRSGVIVTAEERLESDGNIKVTLPGGRLVEASLVDATRQLTWLYSVFSPTVFR
jgi:hypothetical protein